MSTTGGPLEPATGGRAHIQAKVEGFWCLEVAPGLAPMRLQMRWIPTGRGEPPQASSGGAPRSASDHRPERAVRQAAKRRRGRLRSPSSRLL